MILVPEMVPDSDREPEFEFGIHNREISHTGVINVCCNINVLNYITYTHFHGYEILINLLRKLLEGIKSISDIFI